MVRRCFFLAVLYLKKTCGDDPTTSFFSALSKSYLPVENLHLTGPTHAVYAGAYCVPWLRETVGGKFEKVWDDLSMEPF